VCLQQGGFLYVDFLHPHQEILFAARLCTDRALPSNFLLRLAISALIRASLASVTTLIFWRSGTCSTASAALEQLADATSQSVSAVCHRIIAQGLERDE
jgi:hypothetical protein